MLSPDDSFRIKRFSRLQHIISRPGELIGEDGVAFEFAVFGDQLVGIGGDQRMVAFANDRGFTKGPTQIRVAHLAAAESLDFAGAGDRAFDQAAVAGEVLHRGKTSDGIHFVEDGHGQHLSDPMDAEQELEVAALVLLGVFGDRPVEFVDLQIIDFDEFHVTADSHLMVRVFILGENALLPDVPVVSAFQGGDQSLGGLIHGKMGQQLGSFPYETHALTQKSADRSFYGGIDIRNRNEIGS